MQKKKSSARSIRLMPALILVFVVGAGIGLWPGNENALLKKNVVTTLYARTCVGQEPELRAEDFFAEEDKVDYDKISFDLSEADIHVPGVYEVPVLYNGERTNSTVKLTVEETENADRPDRFEETSGQLSLESAKETVDLGK